MAKLALIFFSAAALYVPSSSAGEKTFALGLISDKPAGRIEEYTPFVNYVAGRLKDFNISSGKVVVAKDIHEMFGLIEKGEVDMVFESAFSTIGMKEKGMIPSMLVWRKGVREYRTLFFVRKDSPIKTISDLKGKTIVFEDPESTSGYFMPKAELKRMGMTPLPLDERKEIKDAVRYLFAGEETNQAFWVIQKRADAGAFNNNDWDELSEKVREDLRIIHETGAVPRYMASFPPAMPGGLRKAVEGILEEMDKNPEGQDALKKASGIKKIERLSEDDRKSLKYVKELMRFIEH